ncbi:hypothetical protein ACQZ4Y_20110 [Rhizobium sp. L80/93]|uniref:hypothetical protein n=1 Tax=unclassified Rhizobium TaxID=2613769 RepID=UPI001ADCA86F|nr:MULTISPECIES: hypothetical protein [unclassified Rhizobium]MBO9136908.1 hypothetical protein [Rhizobium sp. B209b/85]MBO9186801.1 hypothetical protein [Rhizobium sp. E27B/91]QXZ99092.1 hypothetical protein J5289_21645 [Rhizobium sp. B230/85]
MSVFNQEELKVFNAVRAAASSSLRKGGSDPMRKSLVDQVNIIDRLQEMLELVATLEKAERVSAASTRGVQTLKDQIRIIQENDAAHAQAIARRGEPG